MLIYVPLARRVAERRAAQRRWWNAFESLLTFVRNDIAKPNLGEHDADKYVPYLWTLFLFLLFCNLLGMIPFMGSPTASIWVTGALALISFIMLHGAAIVKMGLRVLQAHWPRHDDHHEGPGTSPGYRASRPSATGQRSTACGKIPLLGPLVGRHESAISRRCGRASRCLTSAGCSA